VLGGTNLTSNLRAPKTSLSKGIISAAVFAYVTYITVAVVLACTVPREALQTKLRIMLSVVDDNVNFPFVFIGICSTSLSSALSYLVGAPRVLQVMIVGTTAAGNDGRYHCCR
jgi:amino acid transporter